jgi:hypothetical protein
MADCGIGKKDRAYGCLRFEVGGRRATRLEVRGPMTEDIGWKTDDGRRRAASGP